MSAAVAILDRSYGKPRQAVDDPAPSATADPPFGSRTAFAMSARVREAAEAKHWGEVGNPSEVQETIWSWAKTPIEFSQEAGETRSMEQILRDGCSTALRKIRNWQRSRAVYSGNSKAPRTPYRPAGARPHPRQVKRTKLRRGATPPEKQPELGSQPRGLVARVMARHGLTKEEAIEKIENYLLRRRSFREPTTPKISGRALRPASYFAIWSVPACPLWSIATI